MQNELIVYIVNFIVSVSVYLYLGLPREHFPLVSATVYAFPTLHHAFYILSQFRPPERDLINKFWRSNTSQGLVIRPCSPSC
jgi:hypothetical protein